MVKKKVSSRFKSTISILNKADKDDEVDDDDEDNDDGDQCISTEKYMAYLATAIKVKTLAYQY